MNPQGAVDTATVVLDVLGTARAIRAFGDEPVPDELIERLLWAATRASSPSNSQPWEFIVVRDSEVRAQIASVICDAANRSPAVAAAYANKTTASGKTTPSGKTTASGLPRLLAGLARVPVLVLVCGQNVYPPAAPDRMFMWSATFSAAQNMVIAARALGLGTVNTMLHRLAEPQIRDIVGLPADREFTNLLPVGWPAQRFGQLARRPLADTIHRDRWRAAARA